MIPYTELSDEELFSLVKGRDELAFAVLYDRHWGLLYIHAFKFLQEEEGAKDMVQEVFIQVWNQALDITITGTMKAYLFIAVRNRVLNLIRDRKVRENYIGLFSLYIEEHRDTTLEILSEKELRWEIDQIVASFPPRMQEIFQLSRQHYLSHKEIALQLGISEGTVSRQISNALGILRTKLNRPESLVIATLYLQGFWQAS